MSRVTPTDAWDQKVNDLKKAGLSKRDAKLAVETLDGPRPKRPAPQWSSTHGQLTHGSYHKVLLRVDDTDVAPLVRFGYDGALMRDAPALDLNDVVSVRDTLNAIIEWYLEEGLNQ